MKKRNPRRLLRKTSGDVYIDKMAQLGWGIAGQGRARVYVWEGLLGDHLRVGHFKSQGGRTEAAIEEVISRQIEIAEPHCPHFDICGGCLWQHVSYAGQLAMKHEIVKTCFAHERLDTSAIAPVLGSKNPLGYRNKTDFTFGFGQGPALGYFESEIKKTGGRNRSPRGRVPPVFDVQACSLQSDIADTILKQVRTMVRAAGVSFYHPGTRRGVLRSFVIRRSVYSGEMLLHFVAAKPCEDLLGPIAKGLIAKWPQIKGVVLSVNNKRSKNAVPQFQTVLAGTGWIVEDILGVKVRVSATSFLQVNTEQAEQLYRTALDFADLSGTENVIDLYCGTGSLSLLLAQNARQVTGIEVVEAAVDDARANAHDNSISGIEFMCGDVADLFPSCILENDTPWVMTVNPPRGGVSGKVIDLMCQARPARIVYISCNAETLARDLVKFNRGGYGVKAVQPVDMFPQTPHVEVVVKLEPKDL